jgi:hypothetical protein
MSQMLPGLPKNRGTPPWDYLSVSPVLGKPLLGPGIFNACQDRNSLKNAF